MKNFAYTMLVFSVLSLLTACGYKLKGTTSVELPRQLQTLQLPTGNSEILQGTRQALRQNGIVVIGENQAGIYRLNLSNEQVSERVISINSGARAGEYELSMSTTIQLNSAADFIISPTLLEVQRSYLADPNNALAKAGEAELIQNEMRQALVDQVLRRLQNLSFP
jgi:LPS-assembly lipoprotein